MAIVTFNTSVGGDGSSVSDDASATTGLRNYGWTTRFIPTFVNLVAIATFITQKALDCLNRSDAAAESAALAAGYAGSVGSYSAGAQPGQNPLNHLLGSGAYLDTTWLNASATFDPASVANGAQTSTTVAVPGAEFGDFVVSPALSISAAGMAVFGAVTAAGTVTVYYSNTTGAALDLASHTVYVRVLKRQAN